MDSLVEVELIERAEGLEPRGLGEGRIEQSKLRRGELVHHLGTEYEIEGVQRAVEGEARPRVFLVRTVSTAPPNPMLRFVVGSNYMVSGQFRVFHGEKEVTELLDIKTMRMELDADARGRRARTRIHVELLAEAEVTGETELAGYLLEVNRVRTALGLEPLPCDHSTAQTRYVGCGGKAFWICDGCEQVVTRAEREWWPDSAEARATQHGLQRYQLRWGVQSLGQGWFHPSAVERGRVIECGARGRFMVTDPPAPPDRFGPSVVKLVPMKNEPRCARCGLEESVHSHGEASYETHAFMRAETGGRVPGAPPVWMGGPSGHEILTPANPGTVNVVNVSSPEEIERMLDTPAGEAAIARVLAARAADPMRAAAVRGAELALDEKYARDVARIRRVHQEILATGVDPMRVQLVESAEPGGKRTWHFEVRSDVDAARVCSWREERAGEVLMACVTFAVPGTSYCARHGNEVNELPAEPPPPTPPAPIGDFVMPGDKTIADCAAKFDNGERFGEPPFHQLGADPAADAKLASDFQLPEVPPAHVAPPQEGDDIASLPGATPFHPRKVTTVVKPARDDSLVRCELVLQDGTVVHSEVNVVAWVLDEHGVITTRADGLSWQILATERTALLTPLLVTVRPWDPKLEENPF